LTLSSKHDALRYFGEARRICYGYAFGYQCYDSSFRYKLGNRPTPASGPSAIDWWWWACSGGHGRSIGRRPFLAPTLSVGLFKGVTGVDGEEPLVLRPQQIDLTEDEGDTAVREVEHRMPVVGEPERPSAVQHTF
jgi:hypothetical protein